MSGAVAATWATVASSNDDDDDAVAAVEGGELGDEGVGGGQRQLAAALDLDVQRDVREGADDLGKAGMAKSSAVKPAGAGTSPVRTPRRT